VAGRGIVFETNGNKSIVIDQNGIVRKIRSKAGAEAGDEVEFNLNLRRAIYCSVAAAAAVFVLFFFSVAFPFMNNHSGNPATPSAPGTMTIPEEVPPLAYQPFNEMPIGLYIGVGIAVVGCLFGGFMIYRAVKKKGYQED